MSQFFLFDGKYRENAKRPINLGGVKPGTLDRKSLLTTVENERRCRENERKLENAAQLVQHYFEGKCILEGIRDKLTTSAIGKMNPILKAASMDPFVDFLPHFRLIYFSHQIIPEMLLSAAIQKIRNLSLTSSKSNDIISFVYISIKYSLLHMDTFERHDFLLYFFCSQFAITFIYSELFDQFVLKGKFTLDCLLKVLGRFPESRIEMIYNKFFKELILNSDKLSNLIAFDVEFKKIFEDENIIFHALKYYHNHSDMASIWKELPFKLNGEISIEKKTCILRLLQQNSTLLCNFEFLIKDNNQNTTPEYIEALCEFVYSNIIAPSDCLDNIKNDTCNVNYVDDVDFDERISKLSLPDDTKCLIYYWINQLELFFKTSSFSSNLLRDIITIDILKNTHHQLCTFSLFFLMNIFRVEFLEYNFKNDEIIKLYLGKLKNCIHLSKEGFTSDLNVGMVAYLDRENCMREFLRLPLLFPPSTSIISPVNILYSDKLKELPFCLGFNERLEIFRKFTRSAKSMFRRRGIKLEIRRGHEFEDAIPFFRELTPDVFVVFKDEIGFGEGVVKEFIHNALSQALDLNFGLFEVTSNQNLYPSQIRHSGGHFELIGKLFGLMMIFNICSDSVYKFGFSFLSTWKGAKTSLEDLFFVDQELYKNLIYLSKNLAPDLYLDFTIVSGDLEGRKEVELVPNGSNISVTENNKKEYINLVAKYKLHDFNVLSFTRGLFAIIPPKYLEMFNEAELSILVSGLTQDIVIQDWKNHSKFDGRFEKTDKEIFWSAVEMLSSKERSELIRFVTGCPRPPVLGFQSLTPPFTIRYEDYSEEKLPISHTCFNMLVIPRYSSIELCKSKMQTAIENTSSGFQAA